MILRMLFLKILAFDDKKTMQEGKGLFSKMDVVLYILHCGLVE